MAKKYKIHRRIILNGKTEWISANTEQEYAEKLIRLADISSKPAQRRFRDYANNWFAIFSRPNISEAAAIAYRRQLDNHIFPVIGDKDVTAITAADIQRIFNEMGDGAKQETKNKVKTVLSQIFKMATEERIIAFNPMHSTTLRIKGSAASSTEPYPLSDMRYFAEHLADISNEQDRAWLALSISLPLRPEEVLGLRWADIDTDQLVIHVRNTVTHPTRNDGVFRTYLKTEASRRTLAISPWLVAALPKKGTDDEFVIGGYEPLSYTRLRRMRVRIAKQIGYDGTITPRRFRTTVATDISAMTHDLKLVQKMLGHSTPQMTLKHYDKGRLSAVDAVQAISMCYGLDAKKQDETVAV